MRTKTDILDEIDEYIQERLTKSPETETAIADTIQKYGINYTRDISLILKYRTQKTSGLDLMYALKNRDLSEKFTKAELYAAKENGIVIVCSFTYNKLVLCGAINDECGCFAGNDFHLEKNGETWKLCEGKGKCNNLSVLFCNEHAWIGDDRIPWVYETDLPYLPFLMKEEGKPWCQGILFHINDLKDREGSEHV